MLSVSSSEEASLSEATVNNEQIPSNSGEPSSSLGWTTSNSSLQDQSLSDAFSVKEEEMEKNTKTTELEMMKERLSKLLLGEDMSGSGKGVCTALAISNSITNLCASIFGQLWRLEPLKSEKKSMWQREMECLLCVSDHIVEFMPSCQTFPNGSKLEIMTCRPRSDLYINLPALRKLDNMLLEILDSFTDSEFWYIDQGIIATETNDSSSFRRPTHRQEDKWWLPVPRVPPGGLHESSRNELKQKRDCTNQILKAAMVINANVLVDMEIPDSYFETLPKTARASLGDNIYRCISSNQFSPEFLLDCLEISSEHQALEVANRLEAAVYIWKKPNPKPLNHSSNPKSVDKRDLLADRAECLIFYLKRRFPGLSQTTLDISKIQYNKDVGKSILESYSRVLESLASNIIARIDDLLYVDDFAQHSEQFSMATASGVVSEKNVLLHYSFTPPPLITPVKREKPYTKAPNRGFGVKKVLTNYLGMDSKNKTGSNFFEEPKRSFRLQ